MLMTARGSTEAKFVELRAPLNFELRIYHPDSEFQQSVRRDAWSNDEAVKLHHWGGHMPHAQVIVFDDDNNQIAFTCTASLVTAP